MHPSLRYFVFYLITGLLIFPPLYILIVTSWLDGFYERLLGPLSVVPYWLWLLPFAIGIAMLVVACRKPHNVERR